jgi:hypothetical protein
MTSSGCSIANELAFDDYANRLLSVPIPEIEIDTSSPDFRKRGGSKRDADSALTVFHKSCELHVSANSSSVR